MKRQDDIPPPEKALRRIRPDTWQVIDQDRPERTSSESNPTPSYGSAPQPYTYSRTRAYTSLPYTPTTIATRTGQLPVPTQTESTYEEEPTTLEQYIPHSSSAQFTPRTSTVTNHQYVQSTTASTFREEPTAECLRYPQNMSRSGEEQESVGGLIPNPPIFNQKHPVDHFLQNTLEHYRAQYIGDHPEQSYSPYYTIWEPPLSMSPPSNYDPEIDARTHFRRRDDGTLEHENYVEPPPVDLTGDNDDTEPAASDEILDDPVIIHNSTPHGWEVDYLGQWGPMLEYKHFLMGLVPLPPPSPLPPPPASPPSTSSSPSLSPSPPPAPRTLWEPGLGFPETQQLPPHMRRLFSLGPSMRPVYPMWHPFIMCPRHAMHPPLNPPRYRRARCHRRPRNGPIYCPYGPCCPYERHGRPPSPPH